jgi:hypothetical protein
MESDTLQRVEMTAHRFISTTCGSTILLRIHGHRSEISREEIVLLRTELSMADTDTQDLELGMMDLMLLILTIGIDSTQ